MNLWIYRNSLPQSSASRFKEAFRLVVAVLAMKDFQVQIHLQIKGQGLEKFLHQLGVKIPKLGIVKIRLKYQIGATG